MLLCPPNNPISDVPAKEHADIPCPLILLICRLQTAIDFWTDWEDYDLGFRTNLAGFKSVYTPEFLVVHLGGGSAGSSPERYVRIYRNMLFTYFKNPLKKFFLSSTNLVMLISRLQ